MDIGGYQIGQIFHLGGKGPLWRTRTQAGEALLALRCAEDGEQCIDRWKAWSSLSSRHVVRLRDVVRSKDGRWAIIEDFVPGRPLDCELGSPDLRPVATRRQIIEGIAAGVSALHGAGIVHGDLTPANIMITPQGRAVIIDLIDEIGEREGTVGWSLNLTGEQSDRACLRKIAHLLDMDEALDELGFAPADSAGTGVTPRVGEPQEHTIAREPVDPEKVIADLRACALREDTLIEGDERGIVGVPQRQARRLSRAVALVILVGGISALLAGLGIVGWGAWQAMSDQDSESDSSSLSTEQSQSDTQSLSTWCEANELEALINRAIRVRDQAVIAADPGSLTAVLDGELLAQDGQRIEKMRQAGITVTKLSSRVDNVSIVSCQAEEIELTATLTVLAYETCRDGTCETNDGPEATSLLVRVDAVTGKITKANPVTP